MFGIENAGKALIIIGGVLAILGLLLWLGLSSRLPFLGRLPGSIVVQRGRMTIYFPVVTFLLLSLVLTVVLNLIWMLFKK